MTDQAETLVESAQRGDKRAFDELVALYRDRLRTAIDGRIGVGLRKTVEVEDLVQETFLWAFKSVRTFEWQGEDSFLRWLGGISHHVVLKAAGRAKGRESAALTDEIATDENSPSKILARGERFDRLQAAVDTLSPDHRDVILLTRIEGLKVNEAARRMGRSPEAVKKLLRRALKKLREAFGDTESLHLPDRNLNPGGRVDEER